MGRLNLAAAGLRADQRFAEAGRRCISVRSRQLFAHTEGVLDLDRPGHVHDMRVATRRLRAALEVFASCLPPDEGHAVLAEVKRLADALGSRRDCDVQIDMLDQLAEEATGRERDAIGALVGDLHREQRKRNRRLSEALKQAQRDDLAGRLERLTA